MARVVAPALAAALCLLPAVARAHSAIQGAGDFYNGALHPLIVPAHALLLLALGLYLGQRGPDHARLALPSFAGLLLLGLALSGATAAGGSVTAGPVAAGSVTDGPGAGGSTLGSWLAGLLRPALLALALLAGVLVAAAAALPRPLGTALAAASALALGLDSAPEVEDLRAHLVTLAGTWVGAHLVLLNLIGITAFARRRWQTLGIRVLGSWAAASALLVLALALRP